MVLQAGRFLIAPIRLASGIDLHLDADAILEASTDHTRYKAASINWAFQADEALISAMDVHEVSISGTGTIHGRGDTWWPEASADRQAGNPRMVAAGMPASNGLPRPWLIETYRAQGVTIRDVHLVRSPMWAITLRYTQGATLQGLDIANPADAPHAHRQTSLIGRPPGLLLFLQTALFQDVLPIYLAD